MATTASPEIAEPEAGNVSKYVEPDAAQYTRFPPRRKQLITFVLSICGLLTPVGSTTILAAIPEIASTYNTTGTVINISNAVYLVCMGISPSIWGPLSYIYGRRPNCIVSSVLFTAFSIGTALAPNLASFFIFRLLTALFGTAFFVVGTAAIGDIYAPTERGTSLSWFLSGTQIGPCFAPLLGGAIVNSTSSWRGIFWMQTGIGGLATILVFLCLPETIPSRAIDEMHHLSTAKRTTRFLYLLNPARVTVLLLSNPNLWMVGLASSALIFNMYSLLTPIRYILNIRFSLTSPLQSGFFFLAPGFGYLLGTCFGGRLSDLVVTRYIKKRGRRLPEDRLRAATLFLGGVSPVCMLVYGWTVEKRVGGIALPVIVMFIQGVSQLLSFPSLNAYCVDVAEDRSQSSMVVAGNYQIRYAFAAAGSIACLPGTEAIGVGWFSAISAIFLFVAMVLVQFVILYGERWRVGKGSRGGKQAADFCLSAAKPHEGE
ncbi:major facilitator superfamily domain-containing protein [Aspergillus cavernicola]|uniref:Major facilitator superfamily domain-containing protein n=1 Tax=Aspergillus cavernicola TaxID=176166 RepID=A0ABR4I741_9EURO